MFLLKTIENAKVLLFLLSFIRKQELAFHNIFLFTWLKQHHYTWIRSNKMPPKKKTGNEFVWSDDEAELLLNVANEYEVSKVAESINLGVVFQVYTNFSHKPHLVK